MVAGTVALLGAIPFPDSIRGEGKISSTAGNRQTVNIAAAGSVKTSVKVGDRVQPGQVIATITSEDLQQSSGQAMIQWQQAQAQVAIAQQAVLPLIAEVSAAETRVSSNQQKITFLRSQLELLYQGNLPQARQNTSEQAGLSSQVAGLQAQLAIVSARLQRYEQIKDGISLNELEAQRSQQASLTAQIQELQHRLQAKATTPDTLQTDLQQQLSQQEAEMNQAIAALDTQRETLKQAQATVQTHQATAQQHLLELNRQQKRQQRDATLSAKIGGTVVEAKLDSHTPQYLAVGSPILEIVDLAQLVATIDLRPEDQPLVSLGDRARVCPKGEWSCYEGKVKEIAPLSRLNEQKTSASVTVKIQIMQYPEKLPPLDLPLDATVEGRSTSFYQKLQREVAKLTSPRRFV
jgi:HlyD family secretion protein